MRIEDEIKQLRFTNEHHKAIINITYTASWASDVYQKVLKKYGITIQQFNTLCILRSQYPKQISCVEIKSRMLDKNSDVSRLIVRLLAKKLITKSQSLQDKRTANVSISEQGIALLKQLEEATFEIDLKALKISEAEAKELNAILDKARG